MNKTCISEGDQRDCAICGCPITKKDFDDYKMCPWCYSESTFENEGGAIQ